MARTTTVSTTAPDVFATSSPSERKTVHESPVSDVTVALPRTAISSVLTVRLCIAVSSFDILSTFNVFLAANDVVVDVFVHGRSRLSDALVQDVLVVMLVYRRSCLSDMLVHDVVVVDVLVHGRSCLSDALVHDVVVDVLVYRRSCLSDMLVHDVVVDVLEHGRSCLSDALVRTS